MKNKDEISRIALTPIEKVEDWYVKREDKYIWEGINGGKLRAAKTFIENHKIKNGIVTAGASVSPQTLIVAKIAENLGVDCRIHVPMTSKLGREVYEAGKISTIIGHKPGYNSVITSRAMKDAAKLNYLYIPFGMDFSEAIEGTMRQTYNIPEEVKTIVVPVGSAMSLIGIRRGLLEQKRKINLIGIVTGAKPNKRLRKYAPLLNFTLYVSPYNYHHILQEKIGNIELDEVYEAKAWNYVKNWDLTNSLFWIVGKRRYSGFIHLEKEFWCEKTKCYSEYETRKEL